MTVYLIDIDLTAKKYYPQFPELPNHFLMKLSTHFKNKGEKVQLITNKHDLPLTLNKKNQYYGSYLLMRNYEHFKKICKRLRYDMSKITIGGAGKPCKNTYDELPCDYTLYEEYMKKNPKSLLDVNVGLLTRGCIRKCDFCINKNTEGIHRAEELETIYQKKGKPIYLLDDNIIMHPDSPELLRKIGNFGIRENIKFKIHSGVDFRSLKPEHIHALKQAKASIDTIFFSWDYTKDTRTIKTASKLIKEEAGLGLKCNCLTMNKIETTDELTKDILCLLYRILINYTIGIDSMIMVYQDPNGKYKPYYYPIYQYIRNHYGATKQNLYMSLNTKPKQTDKKIREYFFKIMPKQFHNLFTTEYIHLVCSDDFYNQIHQIEDYCGLKHLDESVYSFGVENYREKYKSELSEQKEE